MNKVKWQRLLLITLAVFVSTQLSFGMEANGTQDEEAIIRSVLQDLARASKERDIETVLKLTRDLRWPNPKDQRESMEQMDDRLVRFEATNLVKIDNGLYKATVTHQSLKMDEEVTVEMPVWRENGAWKVIVGQDLEANPVSDRNTIKSSSYYKYLFSGNYQY
ncbi:hypothetical protein [Paenibacillus tarimensis]|nr:hypothetical protein [Paenibacillus tarimensis]